MGAVHPVPTQPKPGVRTERLQLCCFRVICPTMLSGVIRIRCFAGSENSGGSAEGMTLRLEGQSMVTVDFGVEVSPPSVH